MPKENVDEEEDLEVKNSPNAIFTCPNCKKIPQDDVVFLCNKCEQDELIFMNGLYICPNCMEPGENFECINCGSKEVKLKFKKAAKRS